MFESEGGIFRRLTSTVEFSEMTNDDLKKTIPLIGNYAKEFELKVDISVESDFVFRHGHACSRAFGRSVEFIMDAVNVGLTSADGTVRVGSFADAVQRRYGWPPEANPYLATDWAKIDVQKLLGNALTVRGEPAPDRMPSRRT
ncbi:hypothetical protein MKL09_05220 [Methylobacterium sp. J-048]|uniref:hypothetical protein n=1 Tax=Methylobacterium sp. J-048 TaxID=2836635 RepID=UPI001FBBA18A|nr:hypothetical protein [Methylobacterium sp. J-048]MCJ2055949.1 hypothetical protein [Methylobacterium sp. J-048]